MGLCDLLDLLPLDAFAAPVNQPDLVEAFFLSLEQVLVDDARDVARREKVQVDRSLDRNDVHFVRVGHLVDFARLGSGRRRPPRAQQRQKAHAEVIASLLDALVVPSLSLVVSRPCP